MTVIVAYLGCGCVVWYAKREYLPPPDTSGVTKRCDRCSKPSSGIRATEVRTVEAVG